MGIAGSVFSLAWGLRRAMFAVALVWRETPERSLLPSWLSFLMLGLVTYCCCCGNA